MQQPFCLQHIEKRYIHFGTKERSAAVELRKGTSETLSYRTSCQRLSLSHRIANQYGLSSSRLAKNNRTVNKSVLIG